MIYSGLTQPKQCPLSLGFNPKLPKWYLWQNSTDTLRLAKLSDTFDKTQVIPHA